MASWTVILWSLFLSTCNFILILVCCVSFKIHLAGLICQIQSAGRFSSISALCCLYSAAAGHNLKKQEVYYIPYFYISTDIWVILGFKMYLPSSFEEKRSGTGGKAKEKKTSGSEKGSQCSLNICETEGTCFS